MDPQALRLFQLADSGLPIGGFAFSNGLEAMAKLGLLQTRQDFLKHLRALIEELGHFDLPFLNSFYATPFDADIWESYEAMILVPHIRKASILQGRGLLRLLKASSKGPLLQELVAFLKTSPIKAHYLPTLTIGLKDEGFSASSVSDLHLFCIVRDQISAAVRLGLLGPMEGQRIQQEGFTHCTRIRNKAASLCYHDATRTTPALEIAQACHPLLYSKLFQN